MSEEHLGNFEKHVCESMENHDKHICQLAEKVAIGEIRELVESPNYICENCARVAKSNTNLCRPQSLEKAAYHE
jgi:hypothetical protein